MSTLSVRLAFEELQPACTGLASEQTTENIRSLRHVLQKIDEEDLNSLQDYVLFPLRIILKQPKKSSKELYTEVLNCVQDVLLKTEVQRQELFMDLFNCFTQLISPPNAHGGVIQTSEELKLAVVDCIHCLLKHSSNGVLQTVYQPECLPLLGHTVSLLLRLSEYGESRHLKTQAMECLLELSQAQNQQNHQIVFMVSIADIFASFLPGISMSFCRIATGDSKQGHLVIVTALKVWYKITCLVLGERYLTKDDQTKLTENNGDYKKLLVQRNNEWVKSTAEKIHILIENLTSLTSHNHWKVRLTLIDWSKQLLLQCKSSLSKSVPCLLEVLVSLVSDDYPAVVMQSKVFLSEYSQKINSEGGASKLKELLEENLHSLSTQLSRLIRNEGDDRKLVMLRSFHGYLEILGPQTCTAFMSHAHLNRICLSLIQVLELECSDINILQETMTRTEGDLKPHMLQTQKRPKKRFKHFNDERISQELSRICKCLGIHGDLYALIDALVELLNRSSTHCHQAVIIMNDVLLGVTERDQKIKIDIEPLMKTLIEEYITKLESLSNQQQGSNTETNKQFDWIVNKDVTQSSNSLANTKSDIWLTCLLLEGLGNIARVLKKYFNLMLMSVLYTVLEKLGSDISMISQSAYLTLQDICKYCEYNSVEELICLNADYLVSALSVRLRHISQHPSSPNVMKVMIQYSSKDILPIIQNSIQDIMYALDEHANEDSVIFMNVLQTFVTAICKWFPNQCDAKTVIKSDFPHSTQDVCEFLLEHHRDKQIADGYEKIESNSDEIKADEVDADGKDAMENMWDADHKKELPQHIKAVTEVLERCRHFLSSTDRRLRIQVLGIVSVGCEALSGYKNELLPIVHRLWSPFVQRFDDNDMIVTIHAFKTLAAMAEYAEDFIKSRTVKDIIPKITNFLIKQSLISSNVGPAYKHTTACKLQLTLLSGLGSLAEKIDVTENELDCLMSACMPYLSCKQPKALQQTCINAFKCFIRLEPDAVWLKVSCVYHPGIVRPPCEQFEEIKMAGCNQDRNEFAENSVELLKILET